MLELTQIYGRCYEGDFIFSTTSTGASDYIVIPADGDRTSVQLQVLSTASVSVEATISTFASIKEGTAIWKVWDSGSITGGAVAQDSTKGPINAIRVFVNTALAGPNAKLSVRVQKGSVQ